MDADATSGAAVAGAATVYLSGKSTEVAAAAVDTAKEAKEELQQLVNWSGTHHVRPKRFYQPETTKEVEDIVRKCHEQGRTCALPAKANIQNALMLLCRCCQQAAVVVVGVVVGVIADVVIDRLPLGMIAIFRMAAVSSQQEVILPWAAAVLACWYAHFDHQ